MMAFQFLGPIVASVLYVIVFQKAGFRGAILAVCVAPVLTALLLNFLYRSMILSGTVAMMPALLFGQLLSLLPLLTLAFKSWPPASAALNARPEK